VFAHCIANATAIDSHIISTCKIQNSFPFPGSAIKVLVAIHYSVLDARNGYIRNVVA